MIATTAHRIVTPSRTSYGRETRYERVAAALWAIAISLILLCCLLICVWSLFGNAAVVAEPIAGPQRGTSEMSQAAPISAAVIEVQRPKEFKDPPSDRLDVSLLEMTEQVAGMAAKPVIEVVSTANRAVESGHDDSIGDLVPGDPLGVHRPKEQSRRWTIEVTAPRDVVDYAAMLRGFEIEPALVFSDGRIVYLNVQGDAPSVRHSASFDQENRFYARWTQGDLEQLDRRLFASAGVDRADAIIVHFFSAATEALLEQKSLAFAGRSAEQIGRTWFGLEYRNSAAEVEVLRQVQR